MPTCIPHSLVVLRRTGKWQRSDSLNPKVPRKTAKDRQNLSVVSREALPTKMSAGGASQPTLELASSLISISWDYRGVSHDAHGTLHTSSLEWAKYMITKAWGVVLEEGQGIDNEAKRNLSVLESGSEKVRAMRISQGFGITLSRNHADDSMIWDHPFTSNMMQPLDG